MNKELNLEEKVKLYGIEKINTTDAGYYENSYAKFKVDNVSNTIITKNEDGTETHTSPREHYIKSSKND